MNLDEKIVEKRMKSLERNTLDIDCFKDAISIYEIRAEIKAEADRLRKMPANIPCSRAGRRKDSEYENKTGIKSLLCYEDEEFVKECYRRILGREADEDGMAQNLYNLRLREVFKIEIIYNLYRSEEGIRNNCRLRGIKWRYYAAIAVKKIFAVPFAGRIVRYIYKLIRSNKTIYQMRIWNSNIENKILQSEQKIKDSGHQLLQSEQKIKDLGNQLLQSEQKIKDLGNQLLQSEQKIEDLGNQLIRSEQAMTDMGQLLHCYTDENSPYNQRLHLLEENIHNNNILINKHDEFVEHYSESDGKILQRLLVDWCNLKASDDNKDKKTAAAEIVPEISGKNDMISDDKYFAIDYFDFENRFRGSYEHIKHVQEIYLPYFTGKTKVVDLGCGRGEFVQLLQEHGVGVEGVDLYRPYVEYCRMMQLPVKHGDAVQFLMSKEAVDGIFVGQVVEHLKLEQIIALCRIAYEKLEPGCYLIMETPNPMSLAIYTESFYMDPSHNRPVHPRTLQYIAEKEGFSSVEILFTPSSRMPYKIPHISEDDTGRFHEFDIAMEHVENMLYGSQDYAIIARK